VLVQPGEEKAYRGS